MKVYIMEAMCVAVYACFAIAGFYFAAKERRAARTAQGHQRSGQFMVARQAYSIEESEQPHKAL